MFSRREADFSGKEVPGATVDFAESLLRGGAGQLGGTKDTEGMDGR